MTAAIATIEPAQIVAGDRVQWQKTLADYLAGTWTLKYYFRNAAGKIDITAGSSGTDHLVDVSAATSKTWGAGDYDGQGIVSSGTDRFTVWTGRIEVLPNFELAGSYDGRSHARKTLEAIEAVIEGRASLDQQEYTIGNRSLKRTPMADLIGLCDKYRGLVHAEEQGAAAAHGQGSGGRIVTRLK